MDLNRLRTLAERLYLPVVARSLGPEGTAALREMMHVLRELFGYIAPELVRAPLVVMHPIGDRLPDVVEAREYYDVLSLASDYSHSAQDGSDIIAIDPSGRMRTWRSLDIDLEQLSEDYLIYTYNEEREFFVVRGEHHVIYNPNPEMHASVFAIPTFRVLEDALEDYRRRTVRTSRCHILADAWQGGAEGSRLFFIPGPESRMRDSLTQFLDNVLRGAEVRPEQNMDASHPVDIKVTWQFTNRVAVIEIKWLGKSINGKGNIVTYTDRRANEGARQLADYLDMNRRAAPDRVTIGYLVVIDGRRWGLNADSTFVDYQAGMYYADSEINYDPDFHRFRPDFAKPIRMFAEPVCRPN